MMKKAMVYKSSIALMTKKSLMNLPTPFSISLLWNVGFLLGMTLMMQIITGLVLSMNYIPSTDMAFSSVMHIMRDIDSGWAVRYMHMNGASLFFGLMYIHMARGIYFNSPSKTHTVWVSGIILLLCNMATAFLGYVLPWGQMSFWGATVITNMVSAVPYIGNQVMQWLWGDFSISQPTLNRFFSLHFIMPLLMVMLAGVHLILLHETGSSNPMGVNTDYDKAKFHPYYTLKDIMALSVVMIVMSLLISMKPNMLGDVENFTKATPSTTPTHIQPEWYFLFAYAILRSIPSKLSGVVAMVSAILILLILCFKKSTMNKKFSPLKKTSFWAFLNIVVVLTWIGANPVEPPYTTTGFTATLMYFLLVFML